jgi:hypothetical protein
VTKSSSKLDPVTVSDIAHSGLDPTKVYYYAVTASNALGESVLSAGVSAKPVAAPTGASTGLPAPSNIKVQMTGAAALITFDVPPGSATFDIYKDNTSTPTKGNRMFTGKPTNLYLDTSSDAAQSFYSVVAVDNAGAGGTQSTPAMKPASSGTPAPPQNPSPLGYQLH